MCANTDICADAVVCADWVKVKGNLERILSEEEDEVDQRVSTFVPKIPGLLLWYRRHIMSQMGHMASLKATSPPAKSTFWTWFSQQKTNVANTL